MGLLSSTSTPQVSSKRTPDTLVGEREQNAVASANCGVALAEVSGEAAASVGMVMYRDYLHSFWHDDPRSEETHAKYLRRFARFVLSCSCPLPI